MLDLDAGAYSAFVWPAYGLSVVVIGSMIAYVLRRASYWRSRALALTPKEPPVP